MSGDVCLSQARKPFFFTALIPLTFQHSISISFIARTFLQYHSEPLAPCLSEEQSDDLVSLSATPRRISLQISTLGSGDKTEPGLSYYLLRTKFLFTFIRYRLYIGGN